MTIRGLLAATVAALALGACAEEPPLIVKWSKPGASYDTFVADRAACIAYERSQSSGFYLAGLPYPEKGDTLDTDLFVRCMGSHGYFRDPKGYAPPDGDEAQLGP